MAYLTWVARILLFVVLLTLARLNLETVHLNGFLGLEWQGPLAVALLVTLLIGVLLGLLASFRLARVLRAPAPPSPELPPAPSTPARSGYRSPKSVRSSGTADDAGV